MAQHHNTTFFGLNFKQHQHQCGVPAYLLDEVPFWPGDSHYVKAPEGVDENAFVRDFSIRKFIRIEPGDIFFKWCKPDTHGEQHLRRYRALQVTTGVVSKVASFDVPEGCKDRNGSEGGGYQIQVLLDQVPDSVDLGARTDYFVVERVPSEDNPTTPPNPDELAAAWFATHAHRLTPINPQLENYIEGFCFTWP